MLLGPLCDAKMRDKCGFASLLLLVWLSGRPCLSQEISRDVKQQPELSTIVRNWAEKLGGELWHFGELVTRRNAVIESYKRTTVATEDGEAILKDMAEKIKKMMDLKVTAVRRIMEVAENTAVMQDDEVDPSFDFYNAKNLINSAPNETFEEREEQENNNESVHTQKLRQSYDDSDEPGSTLNRLVQPENEFNYQQDQDPPDQTSDDEEKAAPPEHDTKTNEVEVTDGGAAAGGGGAGQDAQASQVPPEDKRRLPLYRNPHFYSIPVNTNHSAVHVPSNVYERSKEVIKGIKWSEELDSTFKNNYKEDPTLSWQYFGSSTGFMRQFPAMIWNQEPVDLFDCRTRSWYIEAASSPKDIVILVDRSGSMTGMRREIARHVVNNILDTLGNNDFVNIFTFSNTTDALMDCFENLLIQANLANVRALKEAMNSFRTEQIANFSLALTTAFKLLQEYREKKIGAQCNQAIMLVTDGVQYNYKEIFKEYNWQNLPFMPVRVFTYLIGREVSDVREVKWMACANQGYYVHLSTYAEVREQVLQYIPVMARPMVLNPSTRPNPTWSPVYADVTDPKLTNWLWVTRERNKQRDRFLLYRRNKTLFISDEQDRKYVHQQKRIRRQESYGEVQIYRLMTSVSLPVYDRRPNANITEKIRINEATWITVTRETRVANLLGVAGTDVPIEYIQRLMMPYRLGVNGYAFIVTNNGYVLIHPDLRPVFQGILKPAYNRVDVLELEIMDDNAEPRDFNESLIDLRRNIVLQSKGHVMLRVKTHLDDLQRVIISNRHYFYMGINNTPFSVVVALPDDYGFNHVQYALDDDIHRMRSNNMIKGSLTQFFTGNWTIHPDWLYCKYTDDKHSFESAEEELLHFLKKIDMPRWKWSRECDSKLIKSLVADAKMTEWFKQNITTTSSQDENGHEFIRRFGVTVAFLSTYSGLTRWQDFPQNIIDADTHDEPHFHQLHNKAVDEVWYRRAIEQHFVEPLSFVYSVPFDVGEENYTVVTASHAIFKEDGARRAPAAVVGFQFYHSALHSLFTKITSICGNIPCKRTCTSEELYCLVLDDNGYVIVSDDRADTGRFFGEIRSDIMHQLVEEGVYRPSRMYDYQATCFRSTDTGNPASARTTLFAHLAHILEWLATVLLRTVAGTLHYYESGEPYDTAEHADRPTGYPCDTALWLYTLTSRAHRGPPVDDQACSRPFAVHRVRRANAVLLVVRNDCPVNSSAATLSGYSSPAAARPIRYSRDPRCVLSEDGLARRSYAECFSEEQTSETFIETCSTTRPPHTLRLAVAATVLAHFSEILRWAAATLTCLVGSVWADDMDYTDQEGNGYSGHTIADEPPSKVNEKEFDRRLLVNKTQPESCDQDMWLYTLNTTSNGYNRTLSNDCSRPFIVQPVTSSNMILLVINNVCIEDPKPILKPDPKEIDYNASLSCYRVLWNTFVRRLYMSCINRSIHEREIELCGTGTTLRVPYLIMLLLIAVVSVSLAN